MRWKAVWPRWSCPATTRSASTRQAQWVRSVRRRPAPTLWGFPPNNGVTRWGSRRAGRRAEVDVRHDVEAAAGGQGGSERPVRRERRRPRLHQQSRRVRNRAGIRSHAGALTRFRSGSRGERASRDYGYVVQVPRRLLWHSRDIEGVLRLRAQNGLGPEDVEAIQLAVPMGNLSMCNIQQPVTGLEGKFSMRFTAAAALCEGEAREGVSRTPALATPGSSACATASAWKVRRPTSVGRRSPCA